MADKKRKKRRTDVDILYDAVIKYVEKKGGKVLVIGGVQIQEWPGDGEFKFTLAIPMTGRKPQKPDPSDNTL